MKTYTQTDIDNQPIDAQGWKRFPSNCTFGSDCTVPSTGEF